jgi:hypothetical protein
VKQQVIDLLEPQSLFVQYDRLWNYFESSGGVATRLTVVAVYAASSPPIHTGTFEFVLVRALADEGSAEGNVASMPAIARGEALRQRRQARSGDRENAAEVERRTSAGERTAARSPAGLWRGFRERSAPRGVPGAAEGRALLSRTDAVPCSYRTGDDRARRRPLRLHQEGIEAGEPAFKGRSTHVGQVPEIGQGLATPVLSDDAAPTTNTAATAPHRSVLTICTMLSFDR